VLSVPIPLIGTVKLDEATLESHESNVSLGNESALLDDNYVAIETVVVTGPPED
jgi:hypothetical protein